MPRAVIIGGAGCVGQWITTRLHASHACVVVDPGTAPVLQGVEPVHKDVFSGSQRIVDLLAAADLVVLSVSADIALTFLERHLALLRRDCAVVDMLSVKRGFSDAIAAQRPEISAIGVNPLFRPQAETNSGTVLLTGAIQSDASRRIAGILREESYSVFETTADAHDRVMCVIQCLTHAATLGFGGAVASIGQPPDGIATPPYRLLMAVFARIMSGAPHVYWDIQRDNIYAAEARRELIKALQRIDRQVLSGDRTEFIHDFNALKGDVEQRLIAASEDAKTLFSYLSG